MQVDFDTPALEAPKGKRRTNAEKAADVAAKLKGDGPAPDEPTPEPEPEQTPQDEPEPEAEPETPEGDPPAEEDEESDGEILPGPAPRDTHYLLASEEPDEKDMLGLYMNGELFSRVNAEAAIKKHPTYDQHPEEGGQDPEPEQEPEADLPAEFAAYIKQVEEAPSWIDVKRAMATFYQTDLFKGWGLAQQNQVRANTWDAVVERKLHDAPDQALDVSAFRLWVEWIDDADAIQGTLGVLEDHPTFVSKDDAFKNSIRGAADTRMKALRG
jgi:hypothetical protein